MRRPVSIAPPKGKLGVLTPGMGAVSTTFMAGVELVRQGRIAAGGIAHANGDDPAGQAHRESRVPKIKEFVQLAELKDLVFGGWDMLPGQRLSGGGQGGRARREGPGQGRKIPEATSSR